MKKGLIDGKWKSAKRAVFCSKPSGGRKKRGNGLPRTMSRKLRKRKPPAKRPWVQKKGVWVRKGKRCFTSDQAVKEKKKGADGGGGKKRPAEKRKS